MGMFMDTLHTPFYEKMIRSVSSNFLDFMVISERIENMLKNGKILGVLGG